MANDEMNIEDQLAQAPLSSKEANPADALIKYTLPASAAAAQPAAAPQAGFDFGKVAIAEPAPEGPRPGSLGWSLMNAFAHPEAQKPGGAVKALLAGSTAAIHHDTEEGAENPEWQGVRNGSPTTPTSPAIQPRKKGFFDDVMSRLGDAGAGAGQRGVVQGFLKSAGAMNDRQRQEQQDQIQMAHSNAEMLKEQLLVHKMGEESRAENIAAGKASVDEMVNAPASFGGENGTEDFKGKTSDELKDLIAKKQVNPAVQTVFATGRKEVGQDSNGVPIYQTTYSVVTPPAKMTISPERAADLNKTLGMELSTDPEKLQVLPGVVANKYIQQAQNARVLAAASLHANTMLGLQVDYDKAVNASKDLSSNGQVVSAVAHEKSGEDDPYAYVKAYNLLKNSNAFTDPKSSLNGKEQAFRMMAGAGDEKNFTKQQDSFAAAQQKNSEKVNDVVAESLKDPSKIQNDTETVLAASKARMTDPSLTPQQRQDAQRVNEMATNVRALKLETEASKELTKDEAKQRVQDNLAKVNNPSGLTGDAFIKSLPPGRANVLKAFGGGTLVLSPGIFRSEKALPLVTDLYTAYPDLDETKAISYAKLRTNFTSGKEAAGLNGINTSLHHINLMDQNLNKATAGYTGTVEQFFGANPAGRAVADDAAALAAELGKLYTGGVIAQAEAEKWQEKLDPKGFGQTVGKLRTNLKEFTKLLGGKIEAYQDQWDDGVPSAFISAPKRIAAPESIQTYKRLTGDDLKVHPSQDNSATANAPAGAIEKPAQFPTSTGIIKGSDGKWYAHDAAHKILGVVPAPAGAQ
jgi:hypothetical protein